MKTVSSAEYFAKQLEVCGKSQKEVAFEAGYERPNIITMFKQGITKIPIAAAPRLAKAINVDPAYFLRLVILDHHPELLEAIEETLGGFVSVNEGHVIQLLREATGNTNPDVPDNDAASKLRKAFRENLAA